MKLVLNKQSSNDQIKQYFEQVLVLKKTNELYPVDIDNVWMLVYADKGKAVRALKKNFIENEDYILLTQNGKQTQGGNNELIYNLSISCLEYFIARKVRSVFDVYRTVFHKIAEQKPLSQLEVIAQSAQILLEQDKRLHSVENKVNELYQRQELAQAEFNKLPTSTTPIQEISLRDQIRMLVHNYNVVSGIKHTDIWNKIYETLYYNYRVSIRSHKKKANEKTWLDVAERTNHLDKIHIIISNLLRESEVSNNK